MKENKLKRAVSYTLNKLNLTALLNNLCEANRYKKALKICLLLFIAISAYQGILIFFLHEAQARQYLAQLLSLVNISIWVGTVPQSKENFNGLGDCFNDQKYAKLHKEFENTLEFKRHLTFLLIYLATWAIVIFAEYWFIVKDFSKSDFCAYVTASLLAVSMILNIFSCYGSLAFVNFLYQFSMQQKNILVDIPHNQPVPSASYGLQRLVNCSRAHSAIFFSEVLFYTLEITVLIFPLSGAEKAYISAHPLRAGFPIFCLLLLGIITFILVYFAPKFFLRRIHTCWKEESLRHGENKLMDTDIDIRHRKELINYLNTLRNDEIDMRPSEAEIVAALSTIVANVLTIVMYLISISSTT